MELQSLDVSKTMNVLNLFTTNFEIAMKHGNSLHLVNI